MSDAVRSISPRTSAISPVLGLTPPRSAGATAPPPAAVTPLGEVTHVDGVLAPRAERPSRESASSTTSLGGAMDSMSLTQLFGPQFESARMSDAEALDATTKSLSAVKALVGNSAHGFAPRLAFTDELGRRNVRLERTYNGVPIFGAEVIAHLGPDGEVADLTGDTLPATMNVDTTARVTADAAFATAQEAHKVKPDRTSGPDLLIARLDDGTYRLAYHVMLACYSEPNLLGDTHYFVDAQTGKVLPLTYAEHDGFVPEHRLTNDAPPFEATEKPASAIAPGTGNSIYMGNVALNTTPDAGRFLLRDPNANNAETRDAHNAGGGIFGGIFGAGATSGVISDDNNRWGEPTDDARAQAGIDAQYHAVNYLRYLREMFGRDGIDNRGMRMISNVHVRQNMVNAFWDGTSMNYGDGDGRNAGPLVDKDVASHEPTHGLTGATSRLVYRGESGALNEAGSDIIGSAGYSWFLRGRSDNGIESDFLIGEDAWTPGVPGDALRYMNDPMRDRERRPTGDVYSRDNYQSRYTGDLDKGGVHLNSGIMNNMFYLMCMGGTNRTSGARVESGIGMEKALRIYYRAHTVYFTPSTTFAQARTALERAATDLYGAGSVELATVRAAASAVGIQETPAAPTKLIG